ncbi:MAG: hypothetical protein V4655_08690 [Bdellovibrionota bacterium]
MKITQLSTVLISALLVSEIAHAGVELELGAGQSTKKIEGDEGEEDSSVHSLDMNLYVGYRIKNFISLGLIATQKNYDMKKAAESLKGAAESFYGDQDVFSSGPASEDSGDATGSSKGLVFGPQITVAYPGKFLQPYFRIAYQMGTLKNLSEYKSSSNYMGTPVSFGMKVETEQKTEFTQIGVGLRVPVSSFYFYVDAAVESMHYKIDSATLVQDISIDEQAYRDEQKIDADTDDTAGGSVLKIGLGYSF